MKYMAVLLATILLSSCALSNTYQKKTVIKLLRFGIYEPKGLTYLVDDDEAPSGKIVNSDKGVRHVIETNEVPAILGIQFGYDFLFSGFKPGEEITITQVLNHPRFTPANKKSFNTQQFTLKKTIGPDGTQMHGASYVLNRSYELVEGDWEFVYYVNGNLKKRIPFKTYKLYGLRLPAAKKVKINK